MTTPLNTEIGIVLDRSGSMQSTAEAVVEGLNKLLAEQKAAGVNAHVTIVEFDDKYDVLQERTPLSDSKPIARIVPRGYTALLDAIGDTVIKVGNGAATANPKPDRVLIAVFTDGGENASNKFSKDTIREMIKTHTADNWEFLFIGSNQDAVLAGSDMGFKPQNTISYASNTAGSGHAFAAASASIGSYSSGGTSNFSGSMRSANAQQIAVQTGVHKLVVQPWKLVQPAVGGVASHKLSDAGVSLHIDRAEAHSYETAHWGRIQDAKKARVAAGDTSTDPKPYLSPDGKPVEVTVSAALFQQIVDAANSGSHGVYNANESRATYGV